MDVFAYSGLSRLEFAERLKISPAVLSHISSGRNQPSLDLILALRRAYPEISLDWLLLGTGNMKRGQSDSRELFSSPGAVESKPEAIPELSVLPAPDLQVETASNGRETEVTDVKSLTFRATKPSEQHREAIMALRIALQMHQQWMEQQLAKLETALKGEE